jgi:hypothetical protein
MKLQLAGLALLAAAVIGMPATAVGYQAQSPQVRVPKLVTPGHLVTLHVSGFRQGSRLHVQFHAPGDNCCLTVPIPPLSRPGLRPSAAGVLRVRMPIRYAQCVQNGCTSPDLKPFKQGQRILILVFTDGYRAEATARSRVG